MNINDFKKTKHADRTGEVPVSALAAFFPKGKKPLLIVRGMSGEEALITNEAASRTAQILAIAQGLAAGDAAAAAAVIEALGLCGTETPPEYSRRLAILEMGSVTPKFDHAAAIHLARNYPTYFLTATTEILNLTGLGRVPGKLPGSGKTAASESP